MRKIILISSLLAIALLSACAFPMRITEVRGSGNLITESRRVSGFETVELSGNGTLIIEQSDVESLEITADENIMPYLRSEVVGGNLQLGTDEFINLLPSSDITYRLTVKNLSAIETSGMGQVEVESLDTDQLELAISGSGTMKIGDLSAKSLSLDISGMGDVYLSGVVEDQRIKISGTGNYQAGDLFSLTAAIDISGSGSAQVWVADNLDLDISGMGDLSYYGEPILNTDISGMGNIKSLGAK